MAKKSKKFRNGLIIFLVLVLASFYPLSKLIPSVSETVYPEPAPSRSGCIGFTCADYFEQGDTMLFKIDSETYNDKCDLDTSFFGDTRDIAIPLLKIYKMEPTPYQSVAILEGERFSFDGNTPVSQTIRWTIPNNAPSGRYKIQEQVFCYRDVEFLPANDIFRGEILYDSVKAVSMETVSYIMISRNKPCLTKGAERCEGNKYQLCIDGDSYNGKVWTPLKQTKGKCGVECIDSSDCSPDKKCDSSFKCVARCTPRFDMICIGNYVYEKNSCTGEETLVKSCGSGYECSNAECQKIQEPEQEPECPSLGTKPCYEAIKTRFAGCDVWDDTPCQISSSCTDGELAYKDCPDESTILESECVNGDMRFTDNSCPEMECKFNSDCAKGYKCIDGGKCIEDEINIVDEDENKTFYTMLIVIIILGVLLFGTFIYLIFSGSKDDKK